MEGGHAMIDISFIGNNIKTIRILNGFSQRDVALKAYVSEATYSKIERGEAKRIDVSMLFSIAEALDVHIFILISKPIPDVPTS